MFQAQDSLNQLATALTAMSNSWKADYAALPRSAPPVADMPIRAWIYNGPGNYFLKTATPAFSAYPGRIADLEGQRRAALLLAELRSGATPRAGLRQAVENATSRNPYNNKPFEWDDKTALIGFTGIASVNNRHELAW